jgi:hypothetical protein
MTLFESWFMARLRFGFVQAGRRAAERLGLTDDSHTGFRPVDAHDVSGRRIGEPVRERAAQEGTAHVSTVGLRDAVWNESQADNRLLIPRIDPVNPGALSHKRDPRPLDCPTRRVAYCD